MNKVFDLVQAFRDNLSLHFYNQSEINREDNSKLGHLNKIKDKDYNKRVNFFHLLLYGVQEANLTT